jgi:hypothetical protein
MGQIASKESSIYLKSYLETEISKTEDGYEFKRQPYKLFEWTHYKNLKKGQTYFAMFESYEIEGIFKSYIFHCECNYCDNCDAILVDNKNTYTIDIHWQFHRVISEKEYMERVRDKYNETVLNIVLKRLVNEDFIW